MKNLYSRYVIAALLALSFFAAGIPVQAIAKSTDEDLQKALSVIEERAEARRKELGIPGMALAIIKDGKIVYLKGLGYKDFENKLPVTENTQFAIGSSTKAFTGLTVLMTADENKISLDDSPKKYLPYFKINDPEIDKNITVRDLLIHSSGLNRTDLGWITGKLNREEIIKVAGEAKPTAKLREKFQYQNVMYAAAGEIVAVTQKMPWEKFVAERIFKPLGMNNSNLSVAEMAKAKDRSFGYEYNFDTKETIKKPYRDLSAISPAGSINSSAADMAKWVQAILNKGKVAGRSPLVTDSSFAEWVKPLMKMTPDGSAGYGLGWMLHKWNGLQVVEHGGNIDGFNATVAMLPEKDLGFVLLTNVTASPIGSEMMSVIWQNLSGAQTASGSVADAEKFVGKYDFQAANTQFEVKMDNGRLVLMVPGQPTYPLDHVKGREFKMGGAPDGFAVRFDPAEGDVKSMFLMQPQGNYTLPRAGTTVQASGSEAAKELIGKYDSNGQQIELRDENGKVSLVVSGQPPYPLIDKAKDVFSLGGLPDSFEMKVIRTVDGKIEKLSLKQPQGTMEYVRTGDVSAEITMTVEEVMQKAIDAVGGEANWRKLNSRVTQIEVDMIHQGLKATGTTYSKAPNLTFSESKITGIGKELATSRTFFNGVEGEEFYSFAPATKYTGKQLENARLGSDFYSLLNWKQNYPKTVLRAKGKLGDEEVYIIDMTPEKGTRVTAYYSAKTFLLLRENAVSVSGTREQEMPYTVIYEDYREVDGVMLPFKQTTSSVSNGDSIMRVISVKHNVPIDDKIFGPANK